MNILISVLLVFGVVLIPAFAIRKPSLFNKHVLIKRIMPELIVKEGDFVFSNKVCHLRMKWLTKTFNLSQVTTIKPYFRQSYSTGSKVENSIAIEFEDGTTALFDISDKNHQEVVNEILLSLDQIKIDWTAFLHVDDNKPFLYQAPILLT